MRSLIKLLVVLVLCLVGIGFYLGWFNVSRPNPGTEGSKVNVNVTVDKDKMKSDVKKAEEKGSSRTGTSFTSSETSFTSSLRLCSSLRWDSAFGGLGLEIETELAGDEGLPALGFDLSLDLFDGGSRESPALATGGASLEFPFGHGASLELKLSLPERGIVLAPSTVLSPGERPVLRVRYRASLSASIP